MTLFLRTKFGSSNPRIFGLIRFLSAAFISLLGILFAHDAFAANELISYRVVNADAAAYSVSGEGNLDGDDIIDVIVAIPNGDTTAPSAGGVYVFLGTNIPEDGSLDVANADFEFFGETENARAGTTIQFLEDEDGDGNDEIEIGFADGDSDVIPSTELSAFSTGDTRYSTTVGVSVGVAKDLDCSLNTKAKNSSSRPAIAAAGMLLALLLALRKSSARRPR